MADSVVIVRRYAAIALLPAAVALGCRDVSAASINLLQAATQDFPLQIEFDSAWTALDRDDRPSVDDCMAVAARAHELSTGLGSVRWNFGRLMWAWDAGSDPASVYLLCIDPRRPTPQLGGVPMIAAASWGSARPRDRNGESRAPTDALASEGARTPNLGDSMPTFVSGTLPGTDLPTSTITTLVPFSRDDLPSVLDSSGSISFATSDDESRGTANETGAGSVDGASFNPSLTSVPADVAAVPEPATWLLMGTGLAAAWRAARRRK